MFYYRGQWQGAYDPHFRLIIEALKQYIEGGYSRVYNKFRITLRNINEYPYGYEDDILYASGEGFRDICGVYADTIHLNHGLPEPIFGSIPILGPAISSDKKKMRAMAKDSWVPSDLIYCSEDSNAHIVRINLGKYVPPFPQLPEDKIIESILASVEVLESKLIDISKSTNSVMKRIQKKLSKKLGDSDG